MLMKLEASLKIDTQRSHQRSAESFMDHSQDTKNGSGPENNVLPSVVLSNVPNPVESDLEPATIYKAADYTTGLANSVALSNLRTEQNTFASVGNVVMPPQSLQESVPVAAENMVYQSNSQLWQGRPCITGSTLLNDTSEQNDLNIEGGSVSLSTAYSQGILNALTQALQSSGMDLSQASISVQIDVGKRANSGFYPAASGSEDHENQIPNNQMMLQTGVQNCNESSDQPHKRVRR
ncbi:transcription factor BIM2-like [Carica papaya]|uniref:transcription factor BIM2-like n=1 Tax=Carica papaya TaxID=3649 RepID=UPI000B8C9B15|nr:transcription factor BIM2-like [Carica papaya]